MKLFLAVFEWYGNYGAYTKRSYIIVAETKQVALGLALENNLDTGAKDWEIEEIDMSKQSAIEIENVERCR